MLYQLFKKAQKEGWAIGQFNFSTLEQLKGIILAAKKLSSPVILGTSENEINFLGLKETLAIVRILEQKLQFSLFLHLDHGKNLDLIKKAIDFGFDSVHFDGSLLSFKENIKLTTRIVKYAHKNKVLVEGELGFLRGESRPFKSSKVLYEIKEKDLTKPEEVEEFVKETGVDSLAIAIGNVHGTYLKMPKLDFERLTKIREKTNIFLVLHGGSGIPPKDLKKAIKLGIQKININTELRVVWKENLQKVLEKSQEVKPYKILPKVEKAIQKKVEKYIRLFGSSNRL